jgi:hypothetical protein
MYATCPTMVMRSAVQLPRLHVALLLRHEQITRTNDHYVYKLVAPLTSTEVEVPRAVPCDLRSFPASAGAGRPATPILTRVPDCQHRAYYKTRMVTQRAWIGSRQ